jgi:hypothetical protein
MDVFRTVKTTIIDPVAYPYISRWQRMVRSFTKTTRQAYVYHALITICVGFLCYNRWKEEFRSRPVDAFVDIFALRDRSLFMAGVGAEEKVYCSPKKSLPHLF